MKIGWGSPNVEWWERRSIYVFCAVYALYVVWHLVLAALHARG